MAVDPVCGMKVKEEKALIRTYQGKTYFFCSRHCRDKFDAGHQITGAPDKICLSCTGSMPFYKNKTLIVAAVLAGLVLASYSVPLLSPFRISFYLYLRTIWWAILFGLVLGGIIDHFVPREYISHILARPGRLPIVYSVLLGFLMSACSHGILALSIQLYKKGASTPAVVAFLLASPWANMTLTIMLVGFFGLKGLAIIFSAVIIALITGLIFQFLEKHGLIEKNRNSMTVDQTFSIIADIRKRLKTARFSFRALSRSAKGIYQGTLALSNMVLWWILIGMGLASMAGAYLPQELIRSSLGPTIGGLLMTLLLATVIEICSEGSAPMAFEIYRQTNALGNSFVFLMAGVVTDYTEIGLLWHNVGRKTALWLPLVSVPQVIILGLLFNLFL